MSLTPEMTSYITTGQCPHCGVAILSDTYVSQNSAQLRSAAGQLAVKYADYLALKHIFVVSDWSILAPSGVKAKVTRSGLLQCLNCMKFWQSSALATWQSSALATGFMPGFMRSQAIRSPLITPLSAPSQVNPLTRRALEPFPLRPPTSVDLSGCRLASVIEEKQVEKFLWEQRKRYANNSGSTVTRELSVTSSITLTVTTDSSNLKSYNAEAGITLLGFAAIQGQVQQQLSERYSVALESSSSVSDKTSVTIKPYSTIEHIIQWKLVTWIGTALLGKTALPSSQPIARVPYQVPVRLTYDDDFIDVKEV